MIDKKLPPTPAGKRPEVVDPNNVPVIFTDWVVTGGSYEGIVNLTLGTIDHSLRRSNDELARVIIAMRLRCSIAFARMLHETLGNILEPKNPLDETPQSPPKNLIN